MSKITPEALRHIVALCNSDAEADANWCRLSLGGVAVEALGLQDALHASHKHIDELETRNAALSGHLSNEMPAWDALNNLSLCLQCQPKLECAMRGEEEGLSE